MLATLGSVLIIEANAADSGPPTAPGRLLVHPRPGLPDQEFNKIIAAHGGRSLGRVRGLDVYIVQLPGNASEKAVAALLKHDPHIKFAEPDAILKAEFVPNDVYFGNEWHLAKIGAPKAWDTSTGQNITVAILDTGVDASHPDLAAKMVPGWNFYDNNSNTGDVFGHGTMVAGTAAAIGNNAVGVAGVAGNSLIMPIRITDASGMAYISTIASGITYAADHGARVANVSFDAAGTYSVVQSAAQYMKGKGGLVVTAAGNSGSDRGYTASDTSITVSATDPNDALASWSSYGKYIDVSAPGVGIWTTVAGGSYGAPSGTSFSSPATAGVVSLMIAANPALAPNDVQNLLFSTATPLGSTGWNMYYGYGRINAAAAVQAASSAIARDTSAPTVAISGLVNGTAVQGLVPVNVTASDDVGVTHVDLFVGSSQIATDTTSPYGFSWDSKTVPDGSVTLKALAYDAANNYSSSSVTVNVANTVDAIAPKASFSSPTNGARVNGMVGVMASATDNIGVVSMTLSIDGKVATTTSGSRLSYNWNTKKISNGTHSLQISAKDAAGNVGSQSIQVTR